MTETIRDDAIERVGDLAMPEGDPDIDLFIEVRQAESVNVYHHHVYQIFEACWHECKDYPSDRSNLVTEVALFELRHGLPELAEEGVGSIDRSSSPYAGTISVFEDRLRVFDAALGSPHGEGVLAALGDLRAEIEEQGDPLQLVRYLVTEVRHGLNIHANTDEAIRLLMDPLIWEEQDTMIPVVQELALALRQRGEWETLDRFGLLFPQLVLDHQAATWQYINNYYKRRDVPLELTRGGKLADRGQRRFVKNLRLDYSRHPVDGLQQAGRIVLFEWAVRGLESVRAVLRTQVSLYQLFDEAGGSFLEECRTRLPDVYAAWVESRFSGADHRAKRVALLATVPQLHDQARELYESLVESETPLIDILPAAIAMAEHVTPDKDEAGLEVFTTVLAETEVLREEFARDMTVMSSLADRAMLRRRYHDALRKLGETADGLSNSELKFLLIAEVMKLTQLLGTQLEVENIGGVQIDALLAAAKKCLRPRLSRGHVTHEEILQICEEFGYKFIEGPARQPLLQNIAQTESEDSEEGYKNRQ